MWGHNTEVWHEGFTRGKISFNIQPFQYLHSSYSPSLSLSLSFSYSTPHPHSNFAVCLPTPSSAPSFFSLRPALFLPYWKSWKKLKWATQKGGGGLLVSIQDADPAGPHSVSTFTTLSCCLVRRKKEKTRGNKRKTEEQCGPFDTGGISKASRRWKVFGWCDRPPIPSASNHRLLVFMAKTDQTKLSHWWNLRR